MSSCSGINKVLRMIDCEVRVSGDTNVTVCSPFVRDDGGAWSNVLGDDRHQSVLASIRHHHHEGVFAASLNPTEHPVTIHMSPSVVLSLTEFRLINFYCFSGAPNSDGVVEEVLAADIAEEVVPIDSNAL